jgi:hypothetical protein
MKVSVCASGIGFTFGSSEGRLEMHACLDFRPMASTVAKNLEAISKAIDQHNSNCPFPAAEVRMNPFEVERLGWDEIRGLPLVADPEIGTGRFRIVCSQDLEDSGLEEVEAVGRELATSIPLER